MIYIVLINKAEKMLLAEMFPHETFVRTMVQKSKRHKYYCVESPRLMSALRNIRNKDIVEEHPPRKKKSNKKNNGNAYQPNKKGWRN